LRPLQCCNEIPENHEAECRQKAEHRRLRIGKRERNQFGGLAKGTKDQVDPPEQKTNRQTNDQHHPKALTHTSPDIVNGIRTHASNLRDHR